MSDTLELETLVVRIVCEAEDYHVGMIAVDQDLLDLGKSVEAFGATLTKMITAPLAAMGAVALREFGSFSEGITRIADAANMTEYEMGTMREAALQMSDDLDMGASKVSGTFGALIRGGFALTEVLDGAGQSAAQLAEVGEVATTTAAETVVKILSVFKKDGLDAAGSVDILSAAADASVISISDMIQSLSQGGSMAASAGQSFRDFSATVALLGQAGIIGSDAGTSIKTFFMRLVNPTDEAAAAMEKYNFQVVDLLGNVKPLRELINELSKSFSGLKQVEKLKALGEIFGADAMRVATVLSEAGVKGFDEIIGKMEEAKTVSEKYTNIQKELSGQWRGFLADLERFGIVLGKHLASPLKALTGVISGMTSWFEGLNSGVQSMLVMFGMAAAATGPLIYGLGMVMVSIAKLPSFLTKMQMAFTVTSNLAVQGLFKLDTALLKIVDVTIEAFTGAEKTIYRAADAFRAFGAAGTKAAIGSVLTSMMTGLQGIVAFMTGPFMMAAMAAGAVFSLIAVSMQEDLDKSYLDYIDSRIASMADNAKDVAAGFERAGSAVDRIRAKMDEIDPSRTARRETDAAQERLKSGLSPAELAKRDTNDMLNNEFGFKDAIKKEFDAAAKYASDDLADARARFAENPSDENADLMHAAHASLMKIYDEQAAANKMRAEAEKDAVETLTAAYTAEKMAAEMFVDFWNQMGTPSINKTPELPKIDEKILHAMKMEGMDNTAEANQASIDMRNKLSEELLLDQSKAAKMLAEASEKLPDAAAMGTQEAANVMLKAISARPEMDQKDRVQQDQLKQQIDMNKKLENIDKNLQESVRLVPANFTA